MNHSDVQYRLLANPEVQRAYDNPPLRLQLARAVVEHRRALGLSQTDFAELLGTSQNQVWRLESGDANVTIKTLEKLHEVLGLNVTIEAPTAPTPTVARKPVPAGAKSK